MITVLYCVWLAVVLADWYAIYRQNKTIRVLRRQRDEAMALAEKASQALRDSTARIRAITERLKREMGL